MLKQNISSFGQRLLSTKLMFCALAWVMANYWLNIGKIDPVIYRDITGLCLAGVLGASWIDTKKPANPDGRILDDANKGG